MSRIGDNIIEVDAAGVIVQGAIRPMGFLVIASADNPVLIMQDVNGQVVFEVKSAVANERFIPFVLPKGVTVTRPNVTTWTNIERLLIYLEK